MPSSPWPMAQVPTIWRRTREDTSHLLVFASPEHLKLPRHVSPSTITWIVQDEMSVGPKTSAPTVSDKTNKQAKKMREYTMKLTHTLLEQVRRKHSESGKRAHRPLCLGRSRLDGHGGCRGRCCPSTVDPSLGVRRGCRQGCRGGRSGR